MPSARAALGCEVIVHAVNPPGYRRWGELVLPMIDNTIAVATAQGATIVLPGTIYNYGPDASVLLRETSPQHPLTRKGAIRVELERRLQVASAHGARAVVLRAGDFFGPDAGNNWFSQALVKPGRPLTRVSVPGAPGVGHQWNYLPDVGRALVELLARREALAPFAAFHMGLGIGMRTARGWPRRSCGWRAATGPSRGWARFHGGCCGWRRRSRRRCAR